MTNHHTTSDIEADSINKDTVTWLLFALALALAPHVSRLPVVITVFCFIFGLWRLLAAHRAWPLPGKGSLIALTLIAFAGLYINYGAILDRSAGYTMLTIMLGLKLLEMRVVRDTMLVIFLGYFLCITTVIYTQTLSIAAYMLFVIVLLTTTLVDLNRCSNKYRLRLNVRQAGNLLLQAIPLMLVMFILFPRVPGPLWQLPDDTAKAKTGLSDTMSPGSFGRLTRSDAVAFRVKFDGTPPASIQRYWRGPVLWYTDGKNWSRYKDSNMTNILPHEVSFEGLYDPISYTVTLEAHNKTWLYALEMPASVPADSYVNADYQLLATDPVRSLKQYTVTSYPNYRTTSITRNEWQRALQLPDNANPRTRALGEQWRDSTTSKHDIVLRALRYYREQPFFYTLNPPVLDGDDPMDEFLFGTRRGFCEHYAASFTVLMRAAGIPTRVVTGYQGGEINPLSDYMIIRQQDAHAWAEVWLENSGWVRMDPTSAVAPDRVEKGFDTAFEQERRQQRSAIFNNEALSDAWRRLRFGWDALNYGWNQWVLGYGTNLQSKFLSGVGIQSWKGMTFWLIFILSTLLLTLALIMIVAQQTKLDPVLRAYQQFCNKLVGRGIMRDPAEGPVDFALRVASLRPDLAEQAVSIGSLYASLRYGPNPSSDLLQRLRQMIRGFKP